VKVTTGREIETEFISFPHSPGASKVGVGVGEKQEFARGDGRVSHVSWQHTDAKRLNKHIAGNVHGDQKQYFYTSICLSFNISRKNIGMIKVFIFTAKIKNNYIIDRSTAGQF
jgi:hypothetical protein